MGGYFSSYEDLVFFDLETTASGRNNIIQIAAKCGNKNFNRYILPRGPISDYTTVKIHGLHVNGGVMYDRRGNPLSTVSEKQALQDLLTFLKRFNNRVILIAHGCYNSDGPILARAFGRSREFSNIVAGFSDTLPILRKKLPGRQSVGKNYRLPDLAREFLGFTGDLHDATVDVAVLEKLAKHWKINIAHAEFVAEMKGIDTML